MSVVVEIDISRGAARRRLEIHRVSTPNLDDDGRRRHEEVGDYVVTCTSGAGQVVRTASFQHAYGDDVTVLIGKAGEAIREKFGIL